MKRCIVLALLLVISLTSVSLAEGLVPFAGVNYSISVPTSPKVFKDNWDMAYLSGGARVGAVLPSLNKSKVFLSADYSQFKTGWDWWYGISDANVFTAFFNGAFNLVPEGSAVPYLLVGVGFFNISGGGDDESAFAAQGGIGISFDVGSSTNLFIEGAEVVGFTEGDATTFLSARVGAALAFE
jgi:hypothetical protein